jgi:uncharacterized membrane protein YozB (DUF420 family)
MLRVSERHRSAARIASHILPGRPQRISISEWANGGGPEEGDTLNEGFLGTAAPRYADFVLLLETGMGVALLIGAALARTRRFRLHALCQSAIVLLNLVVIVLVMVPSFHDHVSPKIPVKLSKAYYALPTAHAALGTITEIAGVYILLAAGTSFVPKRFRITKYKLWMRSVLALWWLVLLLGFATYARWYVPHLARK